jgi:hypothetical protein
LRPHGASHNFKPLYRRAANDSERQILVGDLDQAR